MQPCMAITWKQGMFKTSNEPPEVLQRYFTDVSKMWSVSGECGIRLNFFILRALCSPSKSWTTVHCKATISVLLALLHTIMQRDFFQPFDGVAVGNLGLSAKYFIAGNGIISACLTWCVLPAATARVVWLFAFLKANLNPIAFFIWDNFLNSIPLWIYKLGKRVRPDRVADAPGCCACLWERGVWDSWDNSSVKHCWLGSLPLLCTININFLMESNSWCEIQGLDEASDVCVIRFRIPGNQIVCVGTGNTWELLFALALLLIASRSLLKHSQHGVVGHCWTEIFVSS